MRAAISAAGIGARTAYIRYRRRLRSPRAQRGICSYLMSRVCGIAVAVPDARHLHQRIAVHAHGRDRTLEPDRVELLAHLVDVEVESLPGALRDVSVHRVSPHVQAQLVC